MFRPSSEVEIANEVCWAEERRKAAEAEAEKVKSKQMAAIANAKARRAANDRRVRIGIMTACRNLLMASPDNAFLNPVCVESFLRDGLPNR